MKNNQIVELLAPAGDINKAKTAIDFGADAIYLGGFNYSLRARASNFDFLQIKEISKYCHERNKKWYIVVNVVNQNSMLKNFDQYFKNILKYQPDACIVSDPFIISSIRKIDKKIPIHISTQQSVTNSKAAMFFADNGAQRIILARETTYDETKEMIKNINNKIEVESFIHGAVCVGYSGRCMLSNHFCLRDSNIGGCAQCCRWVYSLYDEKKKYSDKFTMSTKDMCLASKIDEMIKANIVSFKIEGRMKSEYYIATVVNDYRKIIDGYYHKKKTPQYIKDIDNCANRETDLAWYNKNPSYKLMLYHDEQKKVTQNFAFIINKKNRDDSYEIIVKNKILLTNNIEILSKINDEIINVKIKQLIDSEGNVVNNLPTPMTIATIKFNKKINLEKGDIGRIKI